MFEGFTRADVERKAARIAGRERAIGVRGKMLPCGHYPPERVPDDTRAELRAFLAG